MDVWIWENDSEKIEKDSEKEANFHKWLKSKIFGKGLRKVDKNLVKGVIIAGCEVDNWSCAGRTGD